MSKSRTEPFPDVSNELLPCGFTATPACARVKKRTIHARLHRHPWAWLAPVLLLGGCHGALWAQFVVLAVSVGIFVGTVSLGRQASSETTPAKHGVSQRQ